MPQQELVEKGRQVAAHFGLDVSTWKVYVVPSVSKSLTHFGHGISPLTVRITYVAHEGQRAAEVGFDSTGAFNYWRAPDNFKPVQTYSSADVAANAAFQFVAGSQAASFKEPVRSAGDDDDEREFEFKKNPVTNSELRERIKVTTEHSAVQRVERKLAVSSGDDDDDDNDDYWGFLAGLAGLMTTIGFVCMLAIYILWLTRKALNRKLPLRVGVAAFIIMLIVLVAGSNWDKLNSVNLDHDAPVIGEIFIALTIVMYVAVGRGISVADRPKWISLEEMCGLAPLSKPSGESLAAGVLFSPLLVAVPLLLSASGLFPHSWLLPAKAQLLYSRSPFFDSLDIPAWRSLLLLFGFLLPISARILRFRILSWLVAVPLGTLYLADLIRVISGSLPASLTAGFLAFAIFWFVWSNFDILAVLTLHIASGLLLTTLILLQKHEPAWSFIAAFVALLIAAGWCHRRGQPIAEGDPLVSHPMLAGFRAEREKLLAEFSVARRAQQDMLPQSPPEVPGYSLAASCTPSLEVGGDLYDFLKLQDGRIGIGVADVSGKGVPAALYMTLTKGLLSSVTKSNSNIGPVVEEVNKHLHGVTRKKVFVTMALGFLDPQTKIMQCVRAGHNPMVWRQKSRNLTSLVAPGGLGLGITASRVFGTQLKVEEMQLSDGDAVVFYSDGVTEAMNRSLEQFGDQRLMDAVDRTDSMDAAAARDSILDEVRGFLDGVHPQDDMTLVVLRVGELT
jgi:hypothetical protein